jgi:hypothetical protein
MAYAASCLPVVKERVVKLLENELHAAIDFTSQEETFLGVINKSLNALKIAVGVQLTPSFIAMNKTDWSASVWAPQSSPPSSLSASFTAGTSNSPSNNFNFVRSDSHDRHMSMGGPRSPSIITTGPSSSPTSSNPPPGGVGTAMSKAASGLGRMGEKLRTTGLDLFGSKKDKEKAAAAAAKQQSDPHHQRSSSTASPASSPIAASPPAASIRKRSPSPSISIDTSPSPSPSSSSTSTSTRGGIVGASTTTTTTDTERRERTRRVVDGESKASIDSDIPDVARSSQYLRAIIGFLAPQLAVSMVKLPELYSQRKARTASTVTSIAKKSASTNPFASPDDFDMDSPTTPTGNKTPSGTGGQQTNDWEVIADEEVPLVLGAADLFKIVQRMTAKAHYQSFCSMIAAHIVHLFSHHLGLCKYVLIIVTFSLRHHVVLMW